MSTVSQIPITEQVCVKTEMKIVGWRSLTEAEAAGEEQFSSGIAGLAGPAWDHAAYAPPLGFVFPAYFDKVRDGDKPDHPGHPGGVLTPPPDGGFVPPPEVPLPGAFWLFLGAMFLVYAYRQLAKDARPA